MNKLATILLSMKLCLEGNAGVCKGRKSAWVIVLRPMFSNRSDGQPDQMPGKAQSNQFQYGVEDV